MYCGDTQQASGPSTAFNIEFLVQGRDSTLPLHDLTTINYIQRLFSVQLVTSNAAHTNQGEWITLKGRRDNVARAKKYILALCTPEVRQEACRPSQSAGRDHQFSRLLFGENSRIRHELEKEFQTVLSDLSNAGGGVLVQGAEVDVYSTVSKLSSLMETMTSGQTPHHTNPYHPISHASTTPVQSTTCPPSYSPSQMRHTTDTRSNVNEFLRNLPEPVKIALCDGWANRPAMSNIGHPPRLQVRDTYLPRGIDPRQEQRIEYFVSLGYSREKVERVLNTLPDAGDDDILARLVKSPQGHEAVGRKVGGLCRSRARSQNGEPLSSGATNSRELPVKPMDPDQLRHIVIDGSNVAMRHGNGQVFSCIGIKLAVDFFRQRGHTKITVFVPEWRKEASNPDTPITNQEILSSLEQDGCLKFTPSRRIHGRRIVCYDDRFIVKLATKEGGVIVSNDQFRDLASEKPEWREVIETRLLQFTFANDYFMPPDDPLGRNGPSLDQFLYTDARDVKGTTRKVTSDRSSTQQICPHLERCTFGRKCKYYHPDRDPVSEPSSATGSTGSRTPVTSRSPTPSPSPDKRQSIYSGRTSRDESKSGYYGNQPGEDYSRDHKYSESSQVSPPTKPDINIHDLHEHLTALSVRSNPQILEGGVDPQLYAGYTDLSDTHLPTPPQFINLQPPRESYSHVIRSTPSLSTPHDSSMPLQPEGVPAGAERPHMHTFPLMTLPQGPPNYSARPKGVTEDFTRQLQHSQHQGSLPATPSLAPPRRYPPETDQGVIFQGAYDNQRLPQPFYRDQHMSGFPGPGGMPRVMLDTPPGYGVQGGLVQGGLVPRGDGHYFDSDKLHIGQGYSSQSHRHMDATTQRTQESLHHQVGEAPICYDHTDMIPQNHGRIYAKPDPSEPYHNHRRMSYQEPSQRNLPYSPGQHSHPHTVHSSQSYPQLQTPTQVRQLPQNRLPALGEGYVGVRNDGDVRPRYDMNHSLLYQQAMAVLPNCEDRIRRVVLTYPNVSNLDTFIDLVRKMD